MEKQTMPQDSVKRFHSIMDKLFQPPKSVPSSSSNGSGVEEESSRGTKRPNPESALALVEPKAMSNVQERYQHSSASAPAGLSKAPLCRPWDRGDLMRRVATFKSMTWFAKPKVVSAVNCARRGWINVETDTVACEACGARLFFSSPSSWTKQQVEKAASIFSLKLDNGHKLLCPWIDNICDETLAQFPPMPPPVLVDKFKERFSALLQMSALPVISPSAIEYMRSPQLEEFLKWSSILECGNELTNGSQTDSQCQPHSGDLYYQAQKLISLCGWEPRSLPYVINCDDGVNQFVKDVNGQNPTINVHPASSNEIVEVTEEFGAHKSVVLDCRLCGASVGLWAFSTVARPEEFFRIVGFAEVNGENHSGIHGSGLENQVNNRELVMHTTSNGESLRKESPSHLNLTIAGGPPPTKQSFKATVSLPVIGRALRAKFSYDPDFRDYRFDHPKEIQSGLRNENLLQEGEDHADNNLTGQVVLANETGLLNRKPDHESGSSIIEDTLGKENHDHVSAEGPSVTGLDAFSGAGSDCDVIQTPTQITKNVKLGQSQSDLLPENSTDQPANVGLSIGKCGCPDPTDSSFVSLDASLSIGNGEHSNNERSLMYPSDSEVMAGSKGKQLQEENAMKFDPIRQHRHFCPWIASTGGRSPGWQQTLSALHRQREGSLSSPAKSPPSSSLIKVDDPVASVRKLFMSPLSKRMKSAHGAN